MREACAGDLPEPAPVTMAVLFASDSAMSQMVRSETANRRGATSPNRRISCCQHLRTVVLRTTRMWDLQLGVVGVERGAQSLFFYALKTRQMERAGMPEFKPLVSPTKHKY